MPPDRSLLRRLLFGRIGATGVGSLTSPVDGGCVGLLAGVCWLMLSKRAICELGVRGVAGDVGAAWRGGVAGATAAMAGSCKAAAWWWSCIPGIVLA